MCEFILEFMTQNKDEKIFVVSRQSRPKNFRKVWEELLDFQDHPGRITKFMVEYSPLIHDEKILKMSF